MNTLTVLSQAMEENPGMAARLIEDLAGEMRELAQFAEHKEVPLSRELDLCRTHLRVMSTRTEKPWHLEVEGADPEATVPPALFFNLIENGFTHQQPIEGPTRSGCARRRPGTGSGTCFSRRAGSGRRPTGRPAETGFGM